GTARAKDSCQRNLRARFKPRVETLSGVREEEERSIGNRVGDVNLSERKQPAHWSAKTVCPIHQHGASAEATANTRHRNPGRHACFVVQGAIRKTQYKGEGRIAHSMTGELGLLCRSSGASAGRGRRYKI